LRGIERLLRRAQKRKQRYFAIEHGHLPVALAACLAHNGSNPHQVQLTIDPAQAAIIPALIAPAINYCLDQAAAPMLITLDSNLSGPIEELRKIGFQEIERTHTLGLKLAAGTAAMN
ncbi:MAG TPA: hypothetical protein VFK30_06405, partial [Anaerolineae bacterium]|nr:hypothetical protein [Anaerolineae bacterium]